MFCVCMEMRLIALGREVMKCLGYLFIYLIFKGAFMKTSVVLDKRKVTLAKKLGQIHTLRELLDKALDA